MRVLHHIVVGAMFSGILYFYIGWWVLFVFLTNALLDIDHIFYFVYKKRKFSIKENISYNQEDKELHLSVFHQVEFLMLVAMLIFLDKNFLFVSIGVLFHILTDLAYDISTYKDRFRVYSLVYWVLRK